MASSNIRLFLFLTFLSLTFPYALQNRWALRTSQITALKTLKSPIFFQFDQSLSKDGLSIIGFLGITACSIMTYNYEIVDSQIFLTFLSIGRSTRPCQNGQIAFIRTQLDQTFQFYIMYRTLLLKSPNNNPPIKLDLNPNPNPMPINGMWIITDNINKTNVTDGKVIINGTQIAFCQGKQSFLYNISKNAKIMVKLVKNQSDCNNGLLKFFVDSVSFFRLNTLNNPQTLSFFNKQIGRIIQLTYQNNYFPNKIITVYNFRVTLNPTLTHNTVSKDNPVLNKSSSSIALNASNTSPTTNVSLKQSDKNNTKQNNSTKSNITANNSVKATALPNNTQNTQLSTLKPNNSITPATVNTSSITKKLQSKSSPLTNAPQIYSIVSQPNQIYGVWYPSPTIIPNSLTSNDINKYQILINGARIMLNGGCNTIFSPYSFSNGLFKPINIISTSNSCSNTKDSTLQNIIFNEKNIFYYSAGNSNNPKININSPQNTTLLILTQNAPN